MGKFFRNIATLLAERGKLNVAQFAQDYEARYGTPVIMTPGQKVSDVLRNAEAAGTCQLGPNGAILPASTGTLVTAAGAAAAMPRSAVYKSADGSVVVVHHTTKIVGTQVPPTAPPTAQHVVIEAVLCFDTTGSMHKYLAAVRNGLDALVGSLVAKAEEHGAGLRLGVIAHGDYCDKQTSYVIKYIPLLNMGGAAHAKTAALQKVRTFIETVGETGGGDSPECYELALRKATKEMGWGPHSRRLLVMVGDDLPHPPGYTCGDFTNTLDWAKEAASLAKQNVRVYAVQAGNNRDAKQTFWAPLAKMTRGAHLEVSQIETIADLVQAAVCRELGPRAFEAFGAELRARGRMHGETAKAFMTISQTVITVVSGPGGGGDAAAAAASALSLAALPAPPSSSLASLSLQDKGAKDCRYGVGCTNPKCKFAHPAGWRFASAPPPAAAASATRAKDCRYGVACTNPKCYFAHPAGWRFAPRATAAGLRGA